MLGYCLISYPWLSYKIFCYQSYNIIRAVNSNLYILYYVIKLIVITNNDLASFRGFFFIIKEMTIIEC